jgi:glycosyltransferase involved in cell wall biosynthesis
MSTANVAGRRNELPFVSIVIPMFNEERYIARCLEAILHQDYPRDRLEVIVADGMSTDNCAQIVREYSAKYPFIRLIENPRRIMAGAMNRAIPLAKGSIIARMDAHSEYATDYISKCVFYLRKTGAQNAGGVCVTYPGADTLAAKCVAAITSNRLVVGGSPFRVSKRPRYSDSCVFGCWPKEVYDKIGLYNEALRRNEDNDINSRILRYGGKIFQTPDIRLKYYNQATIRGLCRQGYGNGLWNLPMLIANPTTFRFRYFATFFFDLWLFVFGLLSFWKPIFLVPFLLAVVSYALFLVVVMVQVGLGHGWKLVPLVPGAVAGYHIAYGLGTFVSLVRFLAMGSAGRERIRAGSRIPDPDNPPRLGQNALPAEEVEKLWPETVAAEYAEAVRS